MRMHWLLAAAVVGSTTLAQAQTTVRVSLSTTGAQGDWTSELPWTNADGRHVVFTSIATNLVPGDTNNKQDIFVRDRQANTTARASVDSAGAQAGADSYGPRISSDGRYVTFYCASALVAGDTNAKYDVFLRDLQTNTTERGSLGNGAVQGNADSYYGVLSVDNRFLAFGSSASNLVAGDANGRTDLFVRDRTTGVVTLESISTAGVQGNGYCDMFAMSADGRFLAFQNSSSNLVAGDTNGAYDIFVRDRAAGTTTRVSVSSAGAQANSYCSSPGISADGRYVAFQSQASTLVPNDTNGKWDVFVHDRLTATTARVNVDSAGNQANDDSGAPTISADGRFVAFSSLATNLVAGDTNGCRDAFVHDRSNGTTWRVSLGHQGQQANNESNQPVLSGDGLYVVFASWAGNLVPGDTNNLYDVFVRNWLLPCYVDGDLDSYGAGPIAYWGTGGCPSGFSTTDDDCDDQIGWVHPGATELCNFIDDDCDGAYDEDFVSTYCTAGTSSLGCAPSMSWSGCPSASTPAGFVLSASGVDGLQHGLFLYGVSGAAAIPWGGALQCTAAPRQRMSLLPAGGKAGLCDGLLTQDWSTWIAGHPGALGTPFSAGEQVWAQAWYRDPGGVKTSNLSNALRFLFIP